MISWHRLFGMALVDLFAGSPFTVELEKDLSLKQQFLDEVVLRKHPGEFPGRLPDGLEDLAEHNLLSYKSLWEPLDDWAVDELVGHYVNYRRQASPTGEPLLPREHFRLYGISTRFPERLAGEVPLLARQPGVYQAAWGTHRVRVLVLNEMPAGEHNAVWHLFSAVPERVAAGASRYQGHTSDISTILNRLLERYELEGIAMPYTVEDFRRDATREILEELPPEERLRGLPPEERLRGLPPEERLRGMSPEERLRGLSRDELARLEACIRRMRQQDKGKESERH